MDYKEEYQKALERAKKGMPIDEVFPELKESEDERIRKHIIEILERLSPCHWDGNEKSECIAYLERLKDIDCLACDQHLKGYIAGRKVTEEEKQKEQKPAEWSEEDKRKLNRIYAILGQAADTHAFSTTCRLIGDKEAVELQDFLRSIAKPESGEWSEEDERNINTLISVIKAQYNEHDLVRDDYPINARELGDWLKSLRPSWKPSEE